MKKIKNKNGFSFLEVIVATFIFSLIMIAVAMTFSNLFSNYKSSKVIQKDLENAQYAMNVMAKSLRTSSVTNNVAEGNVSTIRFYNYSEGKCISYNFDSSNKTIQVASANDPGSGVTDKKLWCNTATLSDYSNLTIANVNNASFYVTKSDSTSNPVVIGKVTISIEVGSGNDKARIQSTVSLRDYEETM